MFLAARERGRWVILIARQPHDRQRPARTTQYLWGGNTQVFRPKGDLIQHTGRKELRLGVLQHNAYLLGQLGHGRLGCVPPVDVNPAMQAAAARVGQHAVQRLAQRGFPRAIFAQDSDKFTLVNVQAQVFERVTPGAEITVRDVVQDDIGFSFAHRLS